MWISIKPYIEIARLDHWFKNLFVLPGVVMALLLLNLPLDNARVARVVIGLLATSIVASANYVINEILDAPYDRFHPIKKNRPLACGRAQSGFARIEYGVLASAGLLLSAFFGSTFFVANLALLIMGLVYNVPPVRTKDVPILDVLSESINNPIRLLLGWFLITPLVLPPLSALIAYWMLGAFFMAAKRLAEWRELGDLQIIERYRKSLARYTPERLITSMVFYASMFSFVVAIFVVRYRFEFLLLVIPMGILLAEYMRLSFLPHSPVQYPERLYKQKRLMAICVFSVITFFLLLQIDVPILKEIFYPGFVQIK